MQDKPQEENEIDLLELFYVVLHKWKMIVLSLLLTGACGCLISVFLITPQYESTSVLYVLSKSTSITSLADIQMGSSLTNDYVEVVTSRPIIEQVIQNLGLTDETYESLKDKVSIDNPANTRLLKITVRDPQADVAKAIADELADVSKSFISIKMDQAAPTVTQYGYADGEPVTPNTVKNTVLGALIGAVLAIGVVIVSYLLNDTIMTTDDIEKKLGMTVLASIPMDAEEYDGKKSKKSKE
ncbi:MAG: Wzz/FepE/Etk N-terminal domain-containing protein [Wujia sp.]|nr:Wzz/FepE/Etk N-terminal domain-containing protein [Wujia sp.]MDY3728376.1 Wzz/FepE/Etk N-terminal domain-containing protein [Wujia sp.]